MHRWCKSRRRLLSLIFLAVIILVTQQQLGLSAVVFSHSDDPSLNEKRIVVQSSLDQPQPSGVVVSGAGGGVDPFSAEINFHIPAYNRIKNLVLNRTIISWGIKKARSFSDEFRLKAVLGGLGISRLHEMSKEEKQAVWRTNNNHTASPFLWEANICEAIHSLMSAQPSRPHVLFTKCGENAGEFSRHVTPSKTINWDERLSWTKNHDGCPSDQTVFDYLHRNDTRAVFTTQHHFLDHPKVHSLPLGIKHTMKFEILKRIRQPRVKKSKLLMINDNGWKHRKNVTAKVIQNFAKYNHVVNNTYNNKKSSAYLKELQQSKFILAPSGLGWDCYRIWEAIYLNTIPIIERFHRPSDGWRRTLDDLPVLWVEDFADVTPELLKSEYLRIVAQGDDAYKYEKLTSDWWADFVRSKMKT